MNSLTLGTTQSGNVKHRLQWRLGSPHNGIPTDRYHQRLGFPTWAYHLTSWTGKWFVLKYIPSRKTHGVSMWALLALLLSYVKDKCFQMSLKGPLFADNATIHKS
jgi:thiosulfate reductase cytochrome b subunit